MKSLLGKGSQIQNTCPNTVVMTEQPERNHPLQQNMSYYTVASFVPRTVNICDEDSSAIIVLLNKYVLPRKIYIN